MKAKKNLLASFAVLALTFASQNPVHANVRAQDNAVSTGDNSPNRIVWAQITGTTCAYTRASTGWIFSSSHPATGECTFTIPGGVFSAPPICTVTSNDSSGLVVLASDTSATTVATHGFGSANLVANDYNFHIMCIGQQ